MSFFTRLIGKDYRDTLARFERSIARKDHEAYQAVRPLESGVDVKVSVPPHGDYKATEHRVDVAALRREAENYPAHKDAILGMADAHERRMAAERALHASISSRKAQQAKWDNENVPFSQRIHPEDVEAAAWRAHDEHDAARRDVIDAWNRFVAGRESNVIHAGQVDNAKREMRNARLLAGGGAALIGGGALLAANRRAKVLAAANTRKKLIGAGLGAAGLTGVLALRNKD